MIHSGAFPNRRSGKLLTPNIRSIPDIYGGQQRFWIVFRAGLTGGQENVAGDDKAVEPAAGSVLPDNLPFGRGFSSCPLTSGVFGRVRHARRERRQQRQR